MAFDLQCPISCRNDLVHIRHPLQSCSTYISAEAPAGEVEAALEGLEPTGDLTVTRTLNSQNGYDWQVGHAEVLSQVMNSAHHQAPLLEPLSRSFLPRSSNFPRFDAQQGS